MADFGLANAVHVIVVILGKRPQKPIENASFPSANGSVTIERASYLTFNGRMTEQKLAFSLFLSSKMALEKPANEAFLFEAESGNEL